MVSETITLRQRSGPIITIIVWVFLAFLLGDAIVRGAWDTVGRFAPILLLIGVLIYLVLWRPAVIAGERVVIIRELVRTTSVPYSRIRDIRLGTVVAIVTTHAERGTRTYRPWNAPGLPRRKTDSGLNGGMHPDSLEQHPSFELLQRWERASSGGERPGGGRDAASEDLQETVTSWNLGPLCVTFALVLLVIVGLL